MSDTKQILQHFFGPKAIFNTLGLMIIFSIGFITGHNWYKYKLEQKEVIKQQVNTTQTTAAIQNKVEVNQLDSSSYTEKFFNKKGILVHEIEKKHENRASDFSFTKHTDQSEISSEVTSATFSSIEERQESNWLIGFSTPVKIHLTIQDVDVHLGYRLLGPVYITGQTDYKFSKPTVGFLINF